VGLRRALILCWTASAALGRSLAVSGAISLVGPGLGLVPRAMEGVRALAARRRELALRWSGVEIPGPPGPLPPVPEGASGAVARYRWVMSDPQTRREYVWVLVDPLAGAFLAFVPVALVLSGVWGIFLALTREQMQQLAARYNGGPYHRSDHAQAYGRGFDESVGEAKRALES
jgi:hypothetical protein